MTGDLQPKLFTPITLGSTSLLHRVVMAPLTRTRNDSAGVPPDMAIEYYSQRASEGGLLIAEATLVAEEAGAMAGVPGIHSSAQIAQWKKVTEAVHAKGGKIYSQLWAHGRVADPKLAKVVYAAGNIPCEGKTADLKQMTEEDIERFVGHFKQAALNAIEAGFDGIEIHNANGYLLDQFLQVNSNNRTDSYGGSLENRFRFPLAVLNAVSSAIGPERTGIRISPYSRFQGMREEDPLSVFVPFAKAIVAAQPKLSYVHAVEGRSSGGGDTPEHLINKADSLDSVRDAVKAGGVPFLIAGGYTAETAISHAQETGDVIVFGRLFISNPDLPARIKNGWEINQYNRATFYTPGPEGYIDIPPYKSQTAVL